MRIIAFLFLSLPLLADVETATFFLSRADSAITAGRLDEAAKLIERSLDEEEGFLPALVMKARLAQRRGNAAEAIRQLEAVLARKSDARGSVEGRAIREAEELMAKLDSARGAFEKLLAGYTDRLLALADSSEKRKPKLAKACYQQVLAVQPDNAEALRNIKAPVKSPSKSGKSASKARGKPIFNHKDVRGWTGAPPTWTVKDGVLCARLDGVAQISRYRDDVAGDCELIYELRFVETMGKDPLLGLLFGGRGQYDHFGLWIWHDSLRLERQTEEHKRSELQHKSYANLPGKFSRDDWHTYRVARKGKRITVYVDGTEVFSFAGADRKPDGFIGIWAQDALIEIRNISLAR